MNTQDLKVYKAARLFASGNKEDEVRQILMDCIDFDEDDINEIIEITKSKLPSKDSGYKLFIKNVNKVLGEDIYQV